LSAVAATTPQTGLARALVLLSVILATTLYATTLTIANVALPQMQGDLSASIDQIAWVLTFNIVATAIATPPTGWLAVRLGRKRLLVGAGSSIGISLAVTFLVRSTQHNRAELAEHASPFNEILGLNGFDLSSMGGVLAISREIDRQAAMIAYVNDFHIMTLLAFGALPLILLASSRRPG
jgi:MFS family permease